MMLTLSTVLYVTGVSATAVADESEVNMIFERVRNHDFHPLEADSQTMTHDRSLQTPGIADLTDSDWRVRLLAVRDLVRLGEDEAAISGIAEGLGDDNLHVRTISAKALGILRAQSAAPKLEQLLREDPHPLVRAYAAMALGQMASSKSLEVLHAHLEEESHRDVLHQCELAIGQIERDMGATQALQEAYRNLDESQFEKLEEGAPAPEFVLDDTEGHPWRLSEELDGQWGVLIWVFADWCPVCHGEFSELIEMREDFEKANVQVVTLECHDKWRGRVMVGKEIEPNYWFAEQSFKEAYTKQIWWPHLLDRAGAVGAEYGVDPMAFAVHAEYINRPTTVIIDPDGIVRFAYYGTYWGDRPTIPETLEMIQSGDFTFEHPKRLKAGAPAE